MDTELTLTTELLCLPDVALSENDEYLLLPRFPCDEVIADTEEDAHVSSEGSEESEHDDDAFPSNRISEITIADEMAKIGMPSFGISDSVVSEFTIADEAAKVDMPNEFAVVLENGAANTSQSYYPPDIFSRLSQDVDAPGVPGNLKMLLETTFPIPATEFFTLFLSDTAKGFWEDFRYRCGDKELHCTPWRQHEQAVLIRDVSFLHPIKIWQVGKFGSCTEVQKLQIYRNRHLVVETSQYLKGTPLGIQFTIEGVWDVQQHKLEEKSSMLRIYLGLTFLKSNFFNGMIERSTRDECLHAYTLWTQMAHDLLTRRNAAAPGGS